MINQESPVEFHPNPKVLIVCDDADTASVWVYILQQKGWVTVLEKSVLHTFERWAEEIPDLTVIDIQASQTKVLDLCRNLRTASVTPILVFFPVYDETHIIEAYEIGVDECVVKPISPVVFAAKVMAWARRSWMVPVNGLDHLHAGNLTLDPGQRAVIASDGTAIRLTNLEFRLLHLMMSRPKQVLETSQIISSIWGSYGEGDGILLKNVVYRLRRKIEADPGHPQIIQTWPGGYSYQG